MADLKRNESIKTRKLVLLALFCAIIILMGFTPLGFFNYGTIEITLIVIPVAIGAIMLGPAGGAVLGTVFGLVSFIQCFGMSAFGAFMLGLNPVYTFILCLVPRVLVGWLTGLIFRLLADKIKRGGKTISCIIASVCCPLLNTALFITFLIALFGNNKAVLDAFGTNNVWGIVVAIISVNAAIEAVVTLIVSAAVARVLVHFIPDDKLKGGSTENTSAGS
jgi:uncharacterized membrane protein